MQQSGVPVDQCFGILSPTWITSVCLHHCLQVLRLLTTEPPAAMPDPAGSYLLPGLLSPCRALPHPQLFHTATGHSDTGIPRVDGL